MKSAALSAQQKGYIALLLANGHNIEATAKAKGLALPTVRSWFRNPAFKAALLQRQEILSNVANITQAEVVGLLISFARADLADILPDEPIVEAARKAGVSHVIKKLRSKKVTKRNGEVEETIEIEVHDPAKALVQLCKLLGLEGRDDELERGRTAIRTAMALNGFSPEQAIIQLAPHFPAVVRLREEFCGAAIDVTPLKAKKGTKANG